MGPSQRSGRRERRCCSAAAGLAIFLGIWTWASGRLGNAVLLPSPLSVFETYGELISDGSLAGDVRASLVRVIAGFLMAASVAVPLALILAYSRILRGLVMPLIALIRPIRPSPGSRSPSSGWGSETLPAISSRRSPPSSRSSSTPSPAAPRCSRSTSTPPARSVQVPARFSSRSCCRRRCR